MNKPKILAFLLPQFHRIPENDAWWGEGFTEWTNVRRARPLFDGHKQPRVPANQRYYNLLDQEVQAWQADLARQHGIYGFCYYHYWFNGKLLLEQPLNLMLDRQSPDFPFCLAWANEPWTRTWDGGDSHVLMPQDYGGPADWDSHFAYLLRAFLDPRYIRVNGKPMLLIYRTASIDNCADMLARWQQLARSHGLPGLHVVSMLTYFALDTRVELFDAFCEFEPMFTLSQQKGLIKRAEQVFNALVRLHWRINGTARYAKQSRNYRALWSQINRRRVEPKHYPGAFVDWDNSPRKGHHQSLVLRDVSVTTFEHGLAVQYEKARAEGCEYIFLNAWNEWAEGTYLEPDTWRGMQFLEAIARVTGASASCVPAR